MLEKGLMGISEVSDEKAAFPPSLDKIGNTAGGKQCRGCINCSGCIQDG